MRISKEDLIRKAKSGELKKSDGSKVSALDLIKKFKQETVIPKEPTAIDNGLKDLVKEVVYQNKLLYNFIANLSNNKPITPTKKTTVVEVQPKVTVTPNIVLPERKLRSYTVEVQRDEYGDISTFTIDEEYK